MYRSQFELRPLAGPEIQFSLLLLAFLLLLVLGPRAGPQHYGKPVLLPHVQGPDHRIEADGDLVITVQADGYAFIGHKWYPASELLPAVQSHFARTRQVRVLVRLDRTLPFRSVRSLLRVLQAAQVPSAFLVTYESYAGAPDFPLPLLFKSAT